VTESDPFRRPDLLCLDFDGTLVDTRSLWDAAYRRGASARGHKLPTNWWHMIAGKSMDASAVVFDVHDPDEQQQVARDLVDTAGTLVSSYPPVVLPGAEALFARAAHAHVHVCIVTSTWTRLATVLANMAGFPPVAIIGGEKIVYGKPSPDIYVAACESHRVNPHACLAVEDSPSGVAAAYAAGLSVCALGVHTTPKSSRIRLISRLDEVLAHGCGA